MTVKVETTWSLTQKLGDLIVDLHRDHGLRLDEAYQNAWNVNYDPTGHLDAIEDVLFLLGASTLNTHCADCAGIEEEEEI